jgi:cation transport ATPase
MPDPRHGGSRIRSEEVSTVQWDLGIQGVALLIVMALGFGVLTQIVFWHRTTAWLGLIAAAAFFVVGAFISEVWFGWATAEELQPNIDGLSFDEVVLGLFVSIAVVLAARYRIGRSPGHRPMSI